jgi:crotonobetainyl-CoA:carnitine CoA-transferase CaiB-like acyl-CoA transferase
MSGFDGDEIASDDFGPLTGVRVVDLTTTFMGPFCTMHLARLGADVIKVEEPNGDVVRGIMDTSGNGLGPIFLGANHGKRSISIDLKSSRGRAAFLRVVASADVFITNMRPRALGRLGITPEEIHEVNTSCIVASLVGFGEAGRYAGLAAYDDVIQAVSGLADTQGGADGPVYIKSAIADKTVGLMAVNSITAALYARSRTGRGSTVTVPMFESMVAFNLLEHQGGYTYDPPTGPPGYPRLTSPFRRPYRTSDGYLSVVVYTDRMWLSFFDLIGRPELSQQPRYRTITERTRHIDELYELVEIELATKPAGYWLKKLAEVGIPAVRVQSIAELVDDEHLRDVGFFETVEHPVEGTLRLATYPITFSDHSCRELRPAPLLGQHSREVATEAGLTETEIDGLIDDNIIIETNLEGVNDDT